MAVPESGLVDRTGLVVIPGGPGNEEIVNNGERANPCALGSSNCYDRPVGESPYPTFICGQFNTQRFVIADEFVPDTTGNVTNVCWRGQYSDKTQCPSTNPVSTYGEFTLTYFVDNGFGFPNTGAPHGGPFVSPTTLTVTQGATGDPVGYNNSNDEEVGFSASHAPVAVSAGICYWIQFDWTGAPGGTCFFIMALSYENVEGNRRLLRMDINLGNQYQDLNKTNLDTTACIGFDNAGALASSNIVGCGDNRAAPANDNPATATAVACGTSVTADNTLATWDAQYPTAACRKASQDPTEYNAGDVWFSFVATGADAQVSACTTTTLTGQVHGDSLLQIYHQSVPGPDFSNSNMVLDACADDSCSGGLSEVCVATTSGTTYYARFWAFSPVSQGKFAISVNCPCPIASNDICSTAIAVPHNNDGDPGWGDPTGRLVLGATSQATTDGNITGCPGAANTAKGVWYTIIGTGNRVLLNTDQVITGTSFDTRLTVYCSSTNDCTGLSCLAANDDIDATNANYASEVEFCAVLGQKYFILVHGFGSDAGNFGMLVQEIRDGSNNYVPCCDEQTCDTICTFEIPQNATTEQTAIPGGSPAYLQADVACNDALVGNAASGPNGGCQLPAASGQRNFTPLTIGVAMKGDSHSWNGARDFDYYILRSVPNGKGYLIDYSFQARGPMQLIPRIANLNYSLCQTLAYTSWLNETSFCGSGFTRRTVLTSGLPGMISSYDGAGFPNTDLMWRVFNLSTSNGYNCANGLNDYWLRINWVLALDECPPVPTPAGTVGVDYNDERDQATSETYDQSGGANGFQYEPCNYATPNDGVHRGKGGCNEDVPGDGDFIRLNPNTPMIGSMDGLLGGSGAGRDVDWYKFDLVARSIVSFKVTSGGPTQFFITENSCENEAITYSTAATLGYCGARCLDAEDCIVLEAGTYICVGVNSDGFAGGTVFAAIDCTDPGTDIGVAKYRVDINAVEVPACSVTCPGGAVTESEPCPSTYTIFDSCSPTNDGCAGAVFAAGNISSGVPVCGTLFSQYQVFPDDVFSIDTDYWQFTIASRQRLCYSVVADGPVLAQVGVTGANGSLCDADRPNPFTGQGGGLRVLSSANADDCLAGTPTKNYIYLEPGTYSLIVTPGSVEKGFTFADLACVNNAQLSYTASITLDPIGSCTVGSDCTIKTAADCSTAGGSFVADGGTSCGNLFTVGAFNSGCSGYSSIMGNGGVQVALCGDNEVSASQVIPPFKFYGQSYTQVNISTNGYITFGGISSDVARKFANVGNPNAVIAPFWNDWKVACADSVGSGTPTSVWIKIDSSGGLGNEVTTIEWKNLRKFEVYYQSANFQVVLFHNSGEIEFRYGAFTGLTKKDLDEIAVGCEDGCGLRGVDVALSGSFLNGNSCVRLLLTPPCCPGNSDKIPGQVDFSDINAAIANWLTNYGAGTGPGDGNCDGVVNFADINETIANWLSACP